MDVRRWISLSPGDNLGDLKSGQKLLVLGGATLVGMYAIQLAKNAGAHVTVTASDNKMPDGVSKADFCKSLGADEAWVAAVVCKHRLRTYLRSHSTSA